MNDALTGLHHVTAITADAQANVDFYGGVLGLRLVKRTVNFDDPRSLHLYYGTEVGAPGSIVTFFAWPGVARGRIGPPQVTATSFAVGPDALDYWARRLASMNVAHEPVIERFGQPVLALSDPDGMAIELVASRSGRGTPWRGGAIPVEHAIGGLFGVTLTGEGFERSADLFTRLLGFTQDAQEGSRVRFRAGGAEQGFACTLDVCCAPGAPRGLAGAGMVHHVAWRTPDDTRQRGWQNLLVREGFNVSPIMDRTYFRSIYFREPGGVLFEIATDGPGFTVDESRDDLGSSLRLPAALEPRRETIEAHLAPLIVPRRASV